MSVKNLDWNKGFPCTFLNFQDLSMRHGLPCRQSASSHNFVFLLFSPLGFHFIFPPFHFVFSLLFSVFFSPFASFQFCFRVYILEKIFRSAILFHCVLEDGILECSMNICLCFRIFFLAKIKYVYIYKARKNLFVFFSLK